MSFEIDFLLLPIVRHEDHDQGIVPGLWVAQIPGRAARGRGTDRLFLHLSLGGNATLEPQELMKLLDKASQVYYKTPGTVTSAIRKLAELLNHEILARNLRNAGRGLQTVGVLTAGVLRPDRLYLSQSGPAHAFFVSSETVQHQYDPQLAGRGLGLSRTITVRFLQFSPQPGDFFLLSAQPSPDWSASFLEQRRGLNLEALRRDLISQVEIDPFAVLVHVRPGDGKLRLAKPKSVAVLSGDQGETPPISEPMRETPSPGTPPIGEVRQASALPDVAEPINVYEVPDEASADEPVDTVSSLTEPAAPSVMGRRSETAAPSQDRSPVQSVPMASPGTEPSETPQPIAEAGISRLPRLRLPQVSLAPLIVRAGDGVSNASRRLKTALVNGLQRLLPDESLLKIPTSVLAFIAVAIPILVVTVASTVYFQRGRGSQYEAYLVQAQNLAAQAEGQTDPNVLREIYSKTLETLALVESQPQVEEWQTLHQQTQARLDALDWVERLDFQLAISDRWTATAQIVDMVVSGEEFYLLLADGHVLRYSLGAQGYTFDENFACGPSPTNGPLVDIIGLPRANDLNAALAGIDAIGTLVYCRTMVAAGNEPAQLAFNLPTPDSNWGRVRSLALDSDTLHVLDPLTNAVWYYLRVGGGYPDAPGLFFSEQVPDIKNAIALTINRGELYLLRDDGSLVLCTRTGFVDVPTRCQDPVIYADGREGRSDRSQILGVTFSHMQYTQPPDPSIYLLDAREKAIYHFSVRLTLQRQYRSANQLPEGPATAFVVAPNRQVFMAVGNQVFYAVIP
jgi:hypothetical protein